MLVSPKEDNKEDIQSSRVRLSDIIKVVYVVNQPHAKHRWKWTCRELKRVGLSDRIHKQTAIPDSLLEGERAGLTLSHYLCWSEIANEDDPDTISMIVEDDIVFHENIDILFDEYYKEVKKPFHMIFAGTIPYNDGFSEHKVIQGMTFWGLHCLILSRNGARILCEKFKEYFAYRPNISIRSLFESRTTYMYDDPLYYYRYAVDYIVPHIIAHLNEQDKSKCWTFLSTQKCLFKYLGKEMTFIGRPHNKLHGTGLVVQNQLLLSNHKDWLALTKQENWW